MWSGSSSSRTCRSASMARIRGGVGGRSQGVWRRFRRGGQWREMPAEFGAWSTVHNRFRQWRDAGVFEALLEGLIAPAAARGEGGLSPVRVAPTTALAHHDAAGMHLKPGVLDALEKAAEEEKTWSKGALKKNKPVRALM